MLKDSALRYLIKFRWKGDEWEIQKLEFGATAKTSFLVSKHRVKVRVGAKGRVENRVIVRVRLELRFELTLEFTFSLYVVVYLQLEG